MIVKCSPAERFWTCTVAILSLLLLVSLAGLISYYLSQSDCKDKTADGGSRSDRQKDFAIERLTTNHSLSDNKLKKSKQIGRLMRSYLDFGVEPCWDFWEFTCGGHWKLEGTTPTWIFRREFDILALVNRVMSKKSSTHDKEVLEPLQRIYSCCMDAQLDSSKSLLPLYRILNHTGLLPSDGHMFHRYRDVEADHFDSTRLAVILSYLAKNFNLFPLVHPLIKYSKEFNYSLIISPAVTKKPNGNDKSDLMKLFSVAEHQWPLKSWDSAEINSTLINIFQLQTCLAESVSAGGETVLTVADLTQSDNSFNWALFLNSLSEVLNTTEVQIISKTTTTEWKSYWNCFKDTRDSTVKNFLIAKLARSRVRALSGALRKDLGGKTQENWIHCGDFITNTFPTEMAYVLSHNDNFPPSNVPYSKEIFSDVLTTYQSFINSTRWIGKELRLALLEKLSQLKLNSEIGFPNHFRFDPIKGTLRLKNVDFLHLFNQIERLKFQRFTANIRAIFTGVPVESERNLIRGSSGYIAKDNAVIIRLPYLTPGFFGPDYPESWVFGTLGNTISHEIAHAIIHSIRDSNESDAAYMAFATIRQCLTDQFSQDCYQATKGFHGCVDGERTAVENLVDQVGLEMSWRTYQSTTEQSDQPVVGVEQLTSAQTFFISFGLKFCDFEMGEAMETQLQRDNHSPKRTRLNGAMRNSPSFAQQFNCPAGYPMNLVDKCDLGGYRRQ